MGAYILGRILQMIPVVWIITLIVFLIMRVLPGEPVRADERMRQAPHLAFQLAEGLGEPAGEGEVVEFAEGRTVFLPQPVEGSVRIKSHWAEHGAAGGVCRAGV